MYTIQSFNVFLPAEYCHLVDLLAYFALTKNFCITPVYHRGCFEKGQPLSHFGRRLDQKLMFESTCV